MFVYANLVEKENKNEAMLYYKMCIDKISKDVKQISDEYLYPEYKFALNNYALIIKEENKEESIKHLKLAIDLGNRTSMINYADLIKDSNIEEAIKYYKIVYKTKDFK